MFRTSLVCVGLFLAVQAKAEDPQWLKDARALEGKPQPAREFKSVDGFFKAKVPAKVTDKIEKEQGSYTVEIDIGSEDAMLYCEVVPEGLDMAEMMRATFQVILKKTNEADLKVETSALESVDAGSWGNIPYLKASWVYRIFDGKDQLLAGMKQYTFEKAGHGVYCGIIELGYEKTLENVVKSFAETAEFKEPALTPYYTEVNVLSMGERVIGVMQLHLQRDAEGDILTKVETSMMLPTRDGGATTKELVRNEWSSPDGAMINAGHVLATDGEIDTQLSLKRGEDRWVVQGTHERKDFERTLDEGTAPTGTLKLTLDSRKLLAAENPTGGELSALTWDGDDPTKLTGSNLKIKDSAGKGLYKADVRVGSITAETVLDKTGSAVSAEHKSGAMVLKMRRVNATGTF
jgi:hypothetical protein